MPTGGSTKKKKNLKQFYQKFKFIMHILVQVLTCPNIIFLKSLPTTNQNLTASTFFCDLTMATNLKSYAWGVYTNEHNWNNLKSETNQICYICNASGAISTSKKCKKLPTKQLRVQYLQHLFFYWILLFIYFLEFLLFWFSTHALNLIIAACRCVNVSRCVY